MKRTNIVIDEKKLKAAQKAYNIYTAKEIVDFALTEILKAKERQNILTLKGKISLELDLDEHRKVR